MPPPSPAEPAANGDVAVAAEPASNGQSAEPFEIDRALAAVEGDQALLTDLAAAFLDESTQLFAQAKSAFEARDAKELLAVAHTLKGAASVFCADRAVAAAAELEHSAKEADFGRRRGPFGAPGARTQPAASRPRPPGPVTSCDVIVYKTPPRPVFLLPAAPRHGKLKARVFADTFQ